MVTLYSYSVIAACLKYDHLVFRGIDYEHSHYLFTIYSHVLLEHKPL